MRVAPIDFPILVTLFHNSLSEKCFSYIFRLFMISSNLNAATFSFISVDFVLIDCEAF